VNFFSDSDEEVEDMTDEVSGDSYPSLSFGGEVDSMDWTPKVGTVHR
jgi:hypothetical protein